ncbi:hypothetical protein E5P38_22620 [Escherichia coli]|nr:hypothetical protein E5P38_22620 [Escherichia coli]
MNAQEIATKLVERFGSQRKVANECGISQAQISYIVSGKTTDVKTSTITKLKNGLKQKAEQKCTQ